MNAVSHVHYHHIVEKVFPNNVKVMHEAKYSNVKSERGLLARCTFIINEIEWGGVL